MARKTQIVIEDDLSGEILKDGVGETVYFSLDGTSYEIDLSMANAEALRDALSRYVGSARKVAPLNRRTPMAISPRQTSAGGRTDLAEIREWAKASGYGVSERGRVAKTVVEAYDAAH